MRLRMLYSEVKMVPKHSMSSFPIWLYECCGNKKNSMQAMCSFSLKGGVSLSCTNKIMSRLGALSKEFL